MTQGTLQLLGLGTALGLTWEAPLFAPGWRRDPRKLLTLLQPTALAPLLVWCLWDGLVCLVR